MAKLWCSLWWHNKQAVKQTIELVVIWDAMTPLWRLKGTHISFASKGTMQPCVHRKILMCTIAFKRTQLRTYRALLMYNKTCSFIETTFAQFYNGHLRAGCTVSRPPGVAGLCLGSRHPVIVSASRRPVTARFVTRFNLWLRHDLWPQNASICDPARFVTKSASICDQRYTMILESKLCRGKLVFVFTLIMNATWYNMMHIYIYIWTVL